MDENASSKGMPKSLAMVFRMVAHGTGSVLSKHF